MLFHAHEISRLMHCFFEQVILLPQNDVNKPCQNNFECISNECSSNKCIGIDNGSSNSFFKIFMFIIIIIVIASIGYVVINNKTNNNKRKKKK